jgi:enoyl-CoA hydratase
MAIRIETQGPVTTVIMDRPEARNAVDGPSARALADAFRAFDADPEQRVAVLWGAGGTFCAGADLTEARVDMAEGTRRLVALLRQIVGLPKPVVASIDGHVRAGGMGLLGACDIALAGPASTFAFTEVRLGLAPAIISLTTLPRLSARAASRYYLTGETFDATTAARIGLVTEAVDDIDAATHAVLDALRRASPQGLRETKPLTTRAVAFAEASALTTQSARLFASDEAREGMASFLEKRSPRWAL